MATIYPAQIDNSNTLPLVVDNLTGINANTINILRNAIVAIEQSLGINPAGSYGTTVSRLNNIDSAISNIHVISLTNDLGGTLNAPLVIGIQGRDISSASPNNGDVLSWNGLAWIPTSIANNNILNFSKDLSGNSSSQTVIGLQSKPVSSTNPVLGQSLTFTGVQWTPSSIDLTNSNAISGILPVSNLPSLSGDTTGTISANTVTKLYNRSLANTAPNDDQTLSWVASSNQWTPVNQQVTNVSQLRNTDPKTATSIIQLQGYNDINDGGGGIFSWDAASVATDNNGTIFKVGSISTGRWVRNFTTNINVKWFGAKGDIKTTSTGSMPTGSNVLTTSTSVFVLSDVGKYINVTIPGGYSLITTISSYISGTSVTLTNPNSSGSPVSGAVVVWGNNDTSAIQSAFAVVSTGLTIYFPLGVYLVHPNVLSFVNNGGSIVFEGGTNNTWLTGKLTELFGSPTGSMLLCDGVGTVISGPAPTGLAKTSNVTGLVIDNLSISWTINCRNNATPGSIIGINFAGINSTEWKNIRITTPKGSAAWTVVGYTLDMGGEGQDAYDNHFYHCSLIGDEGATPVTSGSKGYYFAHASNINPLFVDGGGSNGNSIIGGQVNAFDVHYHWESVFGGSFSDVTSQDPKTVHFLYGAGPGFCQGVVGDVRYTEGFAYIVQFGITSSPNCCNNVLRICQASFSAGNNDPNSPTTPGIISPLSRMSNNRLEFGGLHGNQVVYPIKTSTTGGIEGVISGKLACRVPGLYLSLDPLTATTTDIVVFLKRLLANFQYGGVIEAYSPEGEVTTSNVSNMVAWWRADQRNLRYPNTAQLFWQDLAASTITTTNQGNKVKYQDGFVAPQISPVAPVPWMQFLPGTNGYWTATLPSPVTACTVALMMQTNYANGTDQGFIEITPAGVKNTGISIVYTASTQNFSARKLAVDKVSHTHNGPHGINADWHLIMATFTNTSTSLYVDGYNVGTTVDAVSLPSMTKICIGALGNGADSFLSGGVAEIMIWNIALNDASAGNIFTYCLDRYDIISG